MTVGWSQNKSARMQEFPEYIVDGIFIANNSFSFNFFVADVGDQRELGLVDLLRARYFLQIKQPSIWGKGDVGLVLPLKKKVHFSYRKRKITFFNRNSLIPGKIFLLMRKRGLYIKEFAVTDIQTAKSHKEKYSRQLTTKEKTRILGIGQSPTLNEIYTNKRYTNSGKSSIGNRPDWEIPYLIQVEFAPCSGTSSSV